MPQGVLGVISDRQHERLDFRQDVRGVEPLTGPPPAFLLVGGEIDLKIRGIGDLVD